ncbi:hypothetical protein Val02_13620 [Virgisporangium aliadipatigenens]|uniref:ARB-07466-like C-terminal domain-containing protein n=1 Tax=Virgisporangium aliadipatigenens TaxID=741659 RepID=A0A8J3YG88_9ACTN|nr:hypothetical protein [Virgisporangium aliadipatigenens]GIJ44476.1 hypothetical protein Val02_13620 [Virgisporangium aliadipatigenens]
MKAALDAANRAFVEAQATLEASRKRQSDLQAQVDTTAQRLTLAEGAAQQIADHAYRSTRLRTASALLNSADPDAFYDRATAIQGVASINDKQIRNFRKQRQELADAKAAVDAEVKLQEQQLAEMDKRKKDAEKAVAQVGGGSTSGPSGSSASAQPAPRNPDGSWPKESCSVKPDPTTKNGCLTPRTNHARLQAVAAGFNHYTACYRSAEDGGEHPRGRACDFAADETGFQNVAASGSDKDYGDRLATYFINNSSKLAVLYVIWYNRIWQSATGNWKAYNGGGDPASNHTNHVHLSVL